MNIVKETEELGEYIINLRREFHKYPELALEEFETSKKIKEELDKIGVKYVQCGKTGIVASLGCENGKTIALRSDMDALKVEENTGVDYTSRNLGVMHACGHDSHMASLIGAVIILKKHEAELKNKIVIIFQPAEENSMGAKQIVDGGHLDGVDEIFGLHVFGDIECGKISIQKGYRMAASHKFKIYIKGKSGHAGKPHQCVDATLVCAAIVMGIQAIVSREIDPIDPAV
ncbi:MAG: M20 metallopeptidase family protein, partial [Clostridium sp.]